MRDWEQLEIECTSYLTQNYGNSEITFVHQGLSDSTTSDIAVNKNNEMLFYIEVKSPNSQSGQFVLNENPNNKKFTYSDKNKTEMTKSKAKIIKFINLDYEKYVNAGTRGYIIDIDKNVISDCVKEHYALKGVKYVMTYDDQYIIIPLERINEYFDITANFRIKKSGSSKVPANEEKIVESFFNLETGIIETYREEKRLIAKTDNTVLRSVVSIDDNEYYFSPRKENEYEIRKLSKTNNMNVIFSLKLIKKQDERDLKDFIRDIKIC